MARSVPVALAVSGLRRPVLTALLLLAGSNALSAQPARRFPPDTATNLQVLAPGTPVPQVISTMRGFSIALDVSCTYCHQGTDDTPFDSIDFAADGKRTKQVARQMMRLLADANRLLDSLPQRHSPAVRITCGTCHRGVAVPIPLPDLIATTTTSLGVDSAAALYRILRRRYFGRAAYDFDIQSLNSAALRVSREGRFEDAIALVQLNDEFHATEAAAPNALGELYLARGDTATALRWYRTALERQPQDRLALTRIRQLQPPRQ